MRGGGEGVVNRVFRINLYWRTVRVILKTHGMYGTSLILPIATSQRGGGGGGGGGYK